MDKCAKSVYLQEYLIILVLLTQGTKEEKRNAKVRLSELENLVFLDEKSIAQAKSNLYLNSEEDHQISMMQLGAS